MLHTGDELIHERVRDIAAVTNEPDLIKVRFDRLRRVLPAIDSCVSSTNPWGEKVLLALLSMGDAPLDEAIRHPHLISPFFAPGWLVDVFAATPSPSLDLARYKRHVWLKILLRDRVERITLKQSLLDLSQLADRVSMEAFRIANTSLPEGLALWAMGKWGANEINASSDIDPVIFSSGGLKSEDADRLVRQWIAVLMPEKGSPVYPVDLRLRPEGTSGPLVTPYRSMEAYLFQRAASWERIAYLRARRVFGDEPVWFRELLDAFLFPSAVNPRQTVAFVGSLLESIHRSARNRDIKRSPGGIRDIEFYVASVQLTEGRELPSIRTGSVMTLLDRLLELNLIDPDTSDRLSRAYRFYRRVENVLQAEADRPDFHLPAPHTPRHNLLAFAMELSPEDLERTYAQHTAYVQDFVARVFESAGRKTAGRGLEIDPQEDETVSPEGESVEGTRDSTVIGNILKAPGTRAILRRLGNRHRNGLQLFDPVIVGTSRHPAETLSRLEAAVASYGGVTAWTAVFPPASARLTAVSRVIANGSRLCEEANSRPYLWEKIGAMDETTLAPDTDSHARISDHLGDRHFQYGAGLLLGDITIPDFLRGWSETVTDAIRLLTGEGLASLSPETAMIAFGKWGGMELAPDADLDLMLVCGDGDSQRLATIQMRAAELLKQAALNGRLTLDPRLRPEGSGAPLVVTVSRLTEYLEHRGQPWEKIALARARLIAGNPQIGRQAMHALRSFTTQAPPPAGMPKLLLARKKAAERKGLRPGVLSLKKSRGGMMDFEFAATFAGWRLGIGKDDSDTGGSTWWSLPVYDRLHDLADRSGDPVWDEAASAYLELRTWEIWQGLQGGRKRGEIDLSVPTAESHPVMPNLDFETIRTRWNHHSELALRLFEKEASGLL